MGQNRQINVASASRTASFDTPIDSNNAKYSDIVIDVTANPGTAGAIVVTLQGVDPASGKKYTLIASSSITAVGTTVLRVGPALTAAANSIANFACPNKLNLNVAHGNANPMTYSVGVCLME